MLGKKLKGDVSTQYFSTDDNSYILESENACSLRLAQST